MSKEVKVSAQFSFPLHWCHVTSRFFTQVGIIGGTGLDNPELLEDRAEKEVDTPFGKARGSTIFNSVVLVRVPQCRAQCRWSYTLRSSRLLVQ